MSQVATGNRHCRWLPQLCRAAVGAAVPDVAGHCYGLTCSRFSDAAVADRWFQCTHSNAVVLRWTTHPATAFGLQLAHRHDSCHDQHAY